MRKIFLILLALMLSVQVTALAKDKGLSAEERIKVAAHGHGKLCSRCRGGIYQDIAWRAK